MISSVQTSSLSAVLDTAARVVAHSGQYVIRALDNGKWYRRFRAHADSVAYALQAPRDKPSTDAMLRDGWGGSRVSAAERQAGAGDQLRQQCLLGV